MKYILVLQFLFSIWVFHIKFYLKSGGCLYAQIKIIKQNWKAKLHVRVLLTGDLVDDMSLLLFDEFDFECIKPGMHCLLNFTLILRFKMKVCPTTNSICFFVFLFLIFNKGTKKFFLNFWIFIQGQTNLTKQINVSHWHLEMSSYLPIYSQQGQYWPIPTSCYYKVPYIYLLYL